MWIRIHNTGKEHLLYLEDLPALNLAHVEEELLALLLLVGQESELA